MPDSPSLVVSCAICLRLHTPADPALSNPVCPACAPRPLAARRERRGGGPAGAGGARD